MAFYEQFIHHLAQKKDDLAQRWFQKLITTEYTPTYRKLSEEEILRRGREDFAQLAHWLGENPDMKQIGSTYVQMGKARYLEGFPLSEIHFAFHLSKSVLWDELATSGILNTSLDLYQGINFLLHLQNFYDMATFYLIRGYQEALYHRMTQDPAISAEARERLFPQGSFLRRHDDSAQRTHWLESWNLFKTN